MKTTTKAAILLLAICMTGTSQVALADADADEDVAFCTSLIKVEVIDAINGATYSGKRLPNGLSKDQVNMVAKAEFGISKLGAGKFEDAVDKLEDISEKANKLADAKPKPKLTGVGPIDSAIGIAAACINGL